MTWLEIQRKKTVKHKGTAYGGQRVVLIVTVPRVRYANDACTFSWCSGYKKAG
jgi:hypothetical protein